MEANVVYAVTVAFLGFAAVAALCYRSQELRSTTLFAPWIWALIAVIANSIYPLAMAFQRPEAHPSAAASAMQFMVQAALLCPFVALLGAKRPQNRAWQLIVLAFLVVLWLPALSGLLLRGGAFQLDSVWPWFLLAVICLGFLNYLTTRFWISGLLLCGGQLVLLGDQVAGVADLLRNIEATGSAAPDVRQVAGMSLILLSLLSIHAANLFARRSSRQRRLSACDREWLEFRDYFGILWSSRVSERFNAAAENAGWNVQLQREGIRRKGDSPSVDAPCQSSRASVQAADHEDAIRQTLENLLSRFVSRGWLQSQADKTRQQQS